MAARRRKAKASKDGPIIAAVAHVLDHGEPTKFALEAACRSGIRSRLCLQGWPWQPADARAAAIVDEALRRIGATRPRWIEGQPEYVQFGFAAYERTRCLQCGWTLPEGHHKFCGPRCANAFHRGAFDNDKLKELAAGSAAWRALQRAAAKPKSCERCGATFRPLRAQRFCSQACAARHNSGLSRHAS